MTKKDNAKKLEGAKKICDLDLIKVEYGQPSYAGASGKMVVRLTSHSTVGDDHFIDIDATDPDRWG